VDVAHLVSPAGSVRTLSGADRADPSLRPDDVRRRYRGSGMRGLRSPLLHFLVLGAVLAGLRAQLAPEAPARPEPVVVDEAALATLRLDWVRSTGREPDASEIDALVRDHVDQELLVRAALAHGLHRTDALVVRRLIQNQRFLEARGAREPEIDAVLLERAFALGLERTDLVVRRRLLERMREILLAAAGEAPKAESASHAEPAEPRVRLTQLAVTRDRHGVDAELRARALVARLSDDFEPGDPALTGLGDPLLLPRDLPLLPLSQLAARFGPDFAEAAAVLPAERWSGPIPSSYGLHAVWVSERTDSGPATAAIPNAASSRTDAREQDSFREAREPALEEALQILRHDVDVIRYDRKASP
jgi:hypothetical protein